MTVLPTVESPAGDEVLSYRKTLPQYKKRSARRKRIYICIDDIKVRSEMKFKSAYEEANSDTSPDLEAAKGQL